MRAPSRRVMAGVSLIEALVALAVMGFGTLSVLGVQGTLRLNADIARQRSEALRIAQLQIEETRRVDTLDAFDALADLDGDEVLGATGETVYTRRVDVELAPLTLDANGTEIAGERVRYKSVTVTVGWTDRTGAPQAVSLVTTVHGALPALSGSLAIPAGAAPVRTPGGRHRSIPLEAVDQGDGSSLFTPPGAASGVRWRFDNFSGVITRLCDTCEPVNALLLSGFVRFALTDEPPIGRDAEVPPSPVPPAVPVALRVLQTAPSNAPSPTCYTRTEPAYAAYWCAVVQGAAGWSGRSELITSDRFVLSAGIEANRYRVCRYTRLVGDPAVPSTANADHPATYAEVKTALVNQNFLVIRAGSGVPDTTPFACPGDDTDTPLVNGQTWLHQP